MCFFFFNDTATTEIYTLSLHDALPISDRLVGGPEAYLVIDDTALPKKGTHSVGVAPQYASALGKNRSEEHTSELQSRQYLVCRLLLEKKKKKIIFITSNYIINHTNSAS